MKKKTVQKKARRAGAAVRKTAQRAAGAAAETTGEVLRDTWRSTLEALTAAEREVEKQVRQLLKRKGITRKDAAALMRDLGDRADAERRKAMKDLQARLSTLQSRVEKERKVVGHAVSEAVTGALGSLNVPTRREIEELTRRVEQLGKKVDKFRARVTRR